MKHPWWKKAVVYQIYPKSFKDTNGDGFGDLQGIINSLDYISKLGAEVIWITPIYGSPQRDNGYDISDYYSIYEPYGTLETFEHLIQEAHARGIKIVMDMVVNHTSTDHKWFQKAKQSRDNPYRNYYIWRDKPTNWLSKFGGSAWEYNETTEQYYLHLFDVTQADLNWEYPPLRQEIYKMMRYWMDKGVDGFRLDVVNLLSKDQNFHDDTLTSSNADGRKYYTDGPRIHEFLKEMNREVFSHYPDSLTVGEMSSTTLESCMKYTNPAEHELTMTFNFHHMKVDYPNGEKWVKAPFDFLALKHIISTWQKGMNEGNGWNALFWCNHDQPRILSRFGNDTIYRVESAKMLATALHMLQGTPYVYQGEEIGMTNPYFQSIDQYRDVESINAYHNLKAAGKSEQEIMEIIQQKSRDNSRTPIQWNDERHGGFTTSTPWIPVAPNYKDIHVTAALQNSHSVFYHYKRLIELRKTYDAIIEGSYELLEENHPQIWAYARHTNAESLLVVNNFYGEEAEFVLSEPGKWLEKQSKILLSNYQDTSEDFTHIKLRPYESIVYHFTE